jgi:thiol-disulfide isomerase/thioredoxin
MKLYPLIFLGLLLIACGEEKTRSTRVAEAVSEELTGDTPETPPVVISEVRAGIPVYNFEGLDRAILQKNNDTTYVVNFWATWCKPCVKEMPYFEQLGEKYAKDRVKVIFVSLDFPDRLESQVVPFIEKNNIRSEVVLLDDDDANSWIPKVSDQWQGAIPATLMFSNVKRAFYERSFTFEELEKEVQSIL